MTSASSSQATGFDPAKLVEAHQNGVWRYLRALGCDPSQADDLTQETFLAVFERPFEDYHPAATAAYLRRVAHNRFISQKRREGRWQEVADLDAIGQLWERTPESDNGEALLDALRQCLTSLTERARWALQMRFRDRLSRMEIAANLEITEHGAKNLMQRAKKKLRECVESKFS